MKLIKILLAFLFLIPYLLKAQEMTFIEPSLEILKKEYPKGYENLNVSALRYAGDVNGDGLADFSLGFNSVNLETEDLNDFKSGYKIYFGKPNITANYDAEFTFNDSDFLYFPTFEPVGDLNGDGCDEHRLESNKFLFDMSCGNYTETLIVEFETNYLTGYSTIEVDVNNDGFEDIIEYHKRLGNDRALNFGIIYGSEDPDSMSYKEFEISFKLDEEDQENRLYREASVTAGDIEGDGEVELIVFGYNSVFSGNPGEYYQGDVLILKQSDSLGYEVVFSYNLPYEEIGEGSKIYLGDYKQGGLKELFINESWETNILLEFGKSEMGFEVLDEINLFKPESELSFLYPIGDYDQDGADDLFSFSRDSYTTEVLFSTSDLGIFEKKVVSTSNRFLYSGPQNFYSNTPEGFLGDLNDDDIDDFLITSTELLEGEESPEPENYLGTGLIFQYGNSGRDLTRRDELFYRVQARQAALSTFNAGDFNGDDIDDYGVLFENSLTSGKNSRIEIFFGEEGKSNWEEADLILQTEEGFQPNYPAIGDFNGDGVTDIVVNYQDSVSGLHFYWGGTNPDSDIDHFASTKSIIGIESFGYNYTGFSTLGNVNDINGDGIDDLGISGPYYSYRGEQMNSTYIFFGGDAISETPDLQLDGRVDRILGLGDIDLDGQNEFLTADIQNDNVKIFEGFDISKGESFNIDPDHIISENILDFTSDVWGMGNNSTIGDFNGDGITDVAIVPRQTNDSERLNFRVYIYNGGPLVFIFYGGENFDSVPDQKIRVPISNLRSPLGISLADTETEFISRFRAELTSVPSYDGDNIDELFLGSFSSDYLTNGLLLTGNGDSLWVDKVFKSPNLYEGLSSIDKFQNTYISVSSAIGDFNADGKLDFLLPQSFDPNFPEDPVYLYSFGTIETSIKEETNGPEKFSLSQNYPNPFNPSTQITYSLVNSGEVSLKVYDITGRLVSTLVDEVKSAGNYRLNFNASGLSSGVYFYRLSSFDGILTKKMTLIK